ncbi:MAG: amidohydrolase [Clostridiaceae bacterium]|nr:amidohydrolase [Clostridiaceae bacterium]
MKKTVLYNAKIYLEKGHFAEACVIEDGTITAVGKSGQLLMASYGADVIDCHGKTVIPGLNDSHCHLMMVAATRSFVPLLGASSIDDVVSRAKAFLETHPNSRGLKGMGWNVVNFVEGEKRDLCRQDLDRISTEIPIVFQRACGHMAACNTKALELARVDATTPQVEGGVFEHEETGYPNGRFSENAKALLENIVPDPTPEELMQNFEEVLHYAASCGLTSVQSNDIGTTLPPEQAYALVHKFHDQGTLLVRYHTQNSFESVEQFEQYMATERKDPRYDNVLSFGPLKLFKDGSIGGHSAMLRKPYLDAPDTCGVSVRSDEELDAFCAAADKLDVQVMCHCIGDGAIDSLLTRYEKILRDGKNPLRHGIIHCQIMDRPMMERLAGDGVLALEQPIFLHSDLHALPTRIPDELARTSNAYRTMKELGVHQAFGTDSPVEDCNPFPCIYCAVNRKDLSGNPAEGYFPEECISVEDAVDCYTIGSAYAQFMEDKKGRIKEGYLADLTVLDRDIFTCDPMELKDVKPVLTLMAGNVTFKA